MFPIINLSIFLANGHETFEHSKMPSISLLVSEGLILIFHPGDPTGIQLEREGERGGVCVSQVEKVIYTQALSPYTQRALITTSEDVSTPRSQVSLAEGLA